MRPSWPSGIGGASHLSVGWLSDDTIPDSSSSGLSSNVCGHTDLNLQLASATFICNSTQRCRVLVSSDQAATSTHSSSTLPMSRPFRLCRGIALSSHSAMFSQLPCFGVAELHALHQRTCPRRLERFIEHSLRVGLEIVTDDRDCWLVGVAPLQQMRYV